MNFRSFKRFFRGGVKQVRRFKGNSAAGRRSTARLEVEALENRLVMSTLPAPTVTDLAQLDGVAASNPVFGPQVAMDPLNPNTLVEVHGWLGPGNVTGAANQINGQLWGNYSFDGGRTWATSGGVFLNSAIIDPATGGPYEQISNVSVSFDRSNRNQLYVVMRQHNTANTSGAIVFNRYTLTTGGFVQDQAVGDKVLYRWFNSALVNADPAFNTYIGIDNNEPSYVDPITGLVQTDTMATMIDDPFDADPTRLIPKAIYVAWNTNQRFPTAMGSGQGSNIFIAASADGGHNWTTQQQVTGFGPGGGANQPRIFFTQGTGVDPNDPNVTPRVAGGMMNILYNNGTTIAIAQTNANPDNTNPLQPLTGTANYIPVAAQQFRGTGGAIFDAASANPDIPSATTFTIPVTLNALSFLDENGVPVFLNDLDVEINLVTAHTAHLEITLQPPVGPSFTLLRNRIDSSGNTISTAVGLPDANDLGVVTDIN
ncbi:MAG: hypothetical protein NZO58_12020, partial [Gemmataceae bacterium]|nr:hypothetical protein [Gemmataceae bacterium]